MYTFERFGTTTLPVYDPRAPLDSGQPILQGIDTPSGTYDALGSERAKLGKVTLNYGCSIIADTAALVETEAATLRALVGKRDKLYIVTPSGGIRWLYARLGPIRSTRVPDFPGRLDLELPFEVYIPIWNGNHHGDGWLLDSGIYLDSGYVLDESGAFQFLTPYTPTVTNDGDYPVSNAVITVTAAGTNITEITIAKTGQTNLKWTGTLAVGKSLVIDCGNYTVKNDGVALSPTGITRQSGHVIAEWLIFDPGSNMLSVTRTGGSTDSTLAFDYSDGYV